MANGLLLNIYFTFYYKINVSLLPDSIKNIIRISQF